MAQMHFDFLIGIILVVVLVVVGLLLLGPVIGFDISKYFSIQFPTGTPGEPQPQGGSSNQPTPDNPKITSQDYDWYSPSEVSCYLSKFIYDQMNKYGNDYVALTTDKNSLCINTEAENRCIAGFGHSKIGIVPNEVFSKLTAVSCGRCGSDGLAVDETCLNYDWSIRKFDSSDASFCGLWYLNNNPVVFANNYKYENLTNNWDTEANNYCYYTNSGESWEKDRVITWYADNSVDDSYKENGTIKYNEVNALKDGVSPIQDGTVDYIYSTHLRQLNYGNSKHYLQYHVRFFKAPISKEITLPDFNFIADYYYVSDKAPMRYNDVGYFYPPARTVLDWNVILTNRILASQLVNNLNQLLKAYDDVDYYYIKSENVQTCTSAASCELTIPKQVVVKGTYDPKDVYLLPDLRSITLKIDRDLNTYFEPGKYRVTLRKWFDHVDDSNMEAWAEEDRKVRIIYDTTVIIYSLDNFRGGGPCTQDSDCPASFCISNEPDSIGSYSCVDNKCELSIKSCSTDRPTCIVEETGPRCIGI